MRIYVTRVIPFRFPGDGDENMTILVVVTCCPWASCRWVPWMYFCQIGVKWVIICLCAWNWQLNWFQQEIEMMSRGNEIMWNWWRWNELGSVGILIFGGWSGVGDFFKENFGQVFFFGIEGGWGVWRWKMISIEDQSKGEIALKWGFSRK